MRAQYEYSIEINGSLYGYLQGFEEKITQQLLLQQQYGSNIPLSVLPGEQSCTVKLKRLRVPDGVLICPEELHNFTMSLLCGERTIQYTGCEFSSLTLQADEHGKTYEELVICASERSVTTI